MNSRGFTLIELLIVIAIVSILSGIATFASQGMMEGYRMRGAARQIISDMQMARIRAIKEGKPWRVCFYPGDDAFTSYFITSSACDSGDAPYKSVKIAAMYGGISFDENFPGGKQVAFTASGSASSGNVELTQGSRSLRIKVSIVGNIRTE